MKTLLILPLLMFCGCAAIAPDADPVVVNAERSTKIAFEAMDSFLSVEHQYRDWFRVNAPDVHVAAERLRANFPPALASARALTKAYKNNRTPSGKLSLETALVLVNQLGAEASAWLASAQRKKTSHYGPSYNIPRHIGRWFTPATHPEIPRSRQAGRRMDTRTGGTIYAGNQPAHESTALAA